jgi:hypothetical protein
MGLMQPCSVAAASPKLNPLQKVTSSDASISLQKLSPSMLVIC